MGKYLTEMEVPQRFIDAMTSTSSTDWLSAADASSMSDVPSIFEWLTAWCGAVNNFISFEKVAREEVQYRRWEKINIARDAIRAIDC
jgi:hypothetical protein